MEESIKNVNTESVCIRISLSHTLNDPNRGSQVGAVTIPRFAQGLYQVHVLTLLFSRLHTPLELPGDLNDARNAEVNQHVQ